MNPTYKGEKKTRENEGPMKDAARIKKRKKEKKRENTGNNYEAKRGTTERRAV